MTTVPTPAPAQPTLRRRLASGGAWALVGKGGTLALNFATVAVVTRVLSPPEAGAYLLALSFVTMAALVARLGLETTLVYLVSSALGSGQPGRARVVVGRVVLVGTLAALAVGAILGAWGGEYLGRRVFGSELVASVGGVVGVWTAALALQLLLAEAFRGFHAIREATLLGGVVSGLVSVAGLLALHASGPVSLAQAVQVPAGAALLSIAVAAIVLTRRTRALGPREPAVAPTYAELVREALPVLVQNTTAMALLQVDVWVVGAHLPEQQVAIYAAAARMVTLVSLASVIGNQVLPPIIGELYARGELGKMERTLRGVAFLVGAPACVVALTFVVFGRPILAFAFGAAYAEGAPILAALTVGQVAAVVTGSTAFTLMMTGHQVAAMWLAAGGFVAAAATTWLAVGPFGSLGVAVALGLTLAVHQLITLLTARRLVGVWTHASAREAIPELRRLSQALARRR